MKKKIAIIATREPSLSSGGEVRNYYLAEELKRQFAVEIFVPTFSHISFLNNTGEINLLHRLKFILSGEIPFVQKLKKAQFSIDQIEEIKNADIIQIEELESYFTFEKYLNNVGEKKLILDTHNIAYQQFLAETESKNIVEKYLGRLLAKKLKKMEIRAIKKFDYILVCSELEKKFFSNYIATEKIIVIPNGANLKTSNGATKPNSNIILFM